MVDCGNPRCAQERRFFKKELLSWSKKVPLMIALEQIAANYSDKENSRQLSNPYTSLEDKEETEDWEADDCCFYCQGQLNNSLDHLEELLHHARDGKLDADSSYVRSLQELLPFYIKYYTHGVGRELLAELGSRSSYSSSTASSAPVASVNTHSTADTEDNEHVDQVSHKAHVELKIPQLQGRGRKGEGQVIAGGKHNYMEEDLEAAVASNRGGKLGTQRASTLFGIPRSSLTNHLFCSSPGMDRAPAFLDPEDSNSGDEAVASAVTSGLKMTDLVQDGTFPYLPPLSFPQPISIGEEQDYSKAAMFDEFSIKLEHIRRMHNLKGDRDLQIKPAHINEPRLPLLSSLIRRLVEQRFQMELSAAHGRGQEAGRNNAGVGSSKAKSPVMEERKSTAISVDTLPHFLPYLPSFSPSCLSLSVPSSFEDLRIPSYKPANVQQQPREVDAMDDESRPFGKVYETSRIGETLKDIIVKSISEKMKFQDMDAPALFPGAGDLFSQAFSLKDAFPLSLGKSAFRSCRSEISQPTHPAKRIKREPFDDQDTPSHSAKSGGDSSRSKSSDHAGQGSGESKSGSSHSASATKNAADGSVKEKKTRPKRGQYRKYNSQLLIEAVRAVQRGEMSVHRAGSYFGVPHSTLEYKVKERHLLRQKKTRESSAASQPASASTTSASIPNASSSSTTTTTTTLTSTSSSTSSSTTQTSKAFLNVTSTASSDSSASSTSSSSQTQLGALSGKAEAPLPSSPSSSLSALGFGLHKQAGGGAEFPWFQPYLLSGASHSPYDPALSLFPQGFALNTSASELLRKLQHKVQSKSSPSSPFSSESSFGFAHPNGSSSLREGFLLFN